MPCRYCEGKDYWECGPNILDLCGGPTSPWLMSAVGGGWNVDGTVELEAGTEYWMKCSPTDCDARVEGDDEKPGPEWKVYGPFEVSESGTYQIACRHGPGGCYVAVKLAEEVA